MSVEHKVLKGETRKLRGDEIFWLKGGGSEVIGGRDEMWRNCCTDADLMVQLRVAVKLHWENTFKCEMTSKC